MNSMVKHCLETITPNLVSLYFGFPRKASDKKYNCNNAKRHEELYGAKSVD